MVLVLKKKIQDNCSNLQILPLHNVYIRLCDYQVLLNEANPTEKALLFILSVLWNGKNEEFL